MLFMFLWERGKNLIYNIVALLVATVGFLTSSMTQDQQIEAQREELKGVTYKKLKDTYVTRWAISLQQYTYDV